MFSRIDLSSKLRCANRCCQTVIGHGDVIAGKVRIIIQEGLQEVVCRQDTVDASLWELRFVLEENGFAAAASSGEQNAGVEMQALVDFGSDVDVLGIESIVLGVLFDEIGCNGVTFPQDQTVIVECGHRVLGIHL